MFLFVVLSIMSLVQNSNITCDSGVVGNARPCQGRDRGFEPRLSLLGREPQPLEFRGFADFFFSLNWVILIKF